MKKILTFLLVAVILVSCMATSVFAANASINVSSATAKAGETVTLSFTMSGNTGFAAYGGTISYDKNALELTAVNAGALSAGAFIGNPATGVATYANFTPVTGDGVLFTATFKVLDGAKENNTVSFVVDKFGISNTDNIIGSVSAGNVKVPHVCAPVAVSQQNATCSADGYKAHYACSCGKLYSDAAGTNSVSKDSLKIAATGHEWNDGVVTTQPGCETKGVKTYTCTVTGCGETKTEDIAATGHKWNDGVVTTQPGCETKGVKTYTCNVTGCGETKTEDVAATGHTAKAAVKENVVAAECEKDGSYDSVVYCGECSKELSREKGIVIPATGHSFSDPVVTKQPTCVDEGVETGTCGSCGKTTSQPIAALGHKYDEGKVTTAPTCVAKGVKTFTCEACVEGTEGHSYTEEIAALGHTYDNGKVTVEPTCTEKGEKLFTCSVCAEGTEGHTKTEVVAALGHTFDQWTEIKAPTCTADGEETHECGVCGHKETRPVEALGHKYDKGEVIKEATKTEKGTKKYTCSVCKYSYEAEYALGDKDSVLGMGDVTMNIALVVMAVTALFGTAIVVKRKAVK